VSVYKLRSIPPYLKINYQPITFGGCQNKFVINVWNLFPIVISGKEEDGIGVRGGVDLLLEPSL